jgi:polar amino acid transport system substrate-binding protein
MMVKNPKRERVVMEKSGLYKRVSAFAAALAIGWGCSVPLPVQAEHLRLVTGELPPYATRERSDEGIALDIVRKAFAHVGTTVSYTFKPWTRSLEEARAGQWDGTAYWGKNPTRDVGFLISDNVLTEQWVFLYRQRTDGGEAFSWETLADLKGQRIAAVQSYTYTPEFWDMQKAGTLKVELAQDDLGNLRRLVAGRVDVVVMERNVACYLMNAHFKPEEVAGVRAHPKLLTSQFTTHLMLSEKLPQSAERMKAFNRGLAQLKKSKDYAALLQYPQCQLAVPAKPLN